MNEQERFKEILAEAAGKQDVLERAAYLDRACGADRELRARIDTLLEVQERARALFDKAVEITTEDLSPEGPGTVIDRYRLLQEIGVGGFGVVYMAEQLEPVKRKVALKIIKPGMDTREVMARFEAERQALALMDHPNIAKVFDGGATESGRPYFVMELVNGMPVTEYCDRERLSTEQRLGVFMEICHAVQHAHQKGIIHRDLKPRNILVTVIDGQPVPKIIDFGIAKALGQKLTEETFYTAFQQMMGTPTYMSPEQAELSGVDVDTRSDVYSLGVVLYVLLAGVTPFEEGTFRKAALDEVRRIIREVEPPKPSTRLKGLGPRLTEVATCRRADAAMLPRALDGDLDWIVMKCLEKDRQRRYQTVNGLAQDLERHLSHQPVLVRPASIGYRVKKFYRRNQVLTLAGAAVAATLILGVVGSTWQAVRAARERLRAEEGERYTQRLLYAANMNLTQQAWERNNVDRVRQLLDETAAFPDKGFEWYYWQRQTHLQLRTLRGHADKILCLAVSPDGTRIASGSRDDTLKVWDAGSGKELLSLSNVVTRLDNPGLVGWVDGIQWIAFSPDGTRIATAAGCKIKVWEADTGELLQMHVASPDYIGNPRVSFRSDGSLIIAGERYIGGQRMTVWQPSTGKKEGCLLRSQWGSPEAEVAFSRDGKLVATTAATGDIVLWDMTTEEELRRMTPYRSEVTSMAFSPDGKQLLEGREDYLARSWEVQTGKKLITFRGHSGRICSVAYLPGGRRIVTSSLDQTVKVWEADTGKELFTFKSQGPAFAVSPDGQWVVCASGSAVANIWQMADSNGPRIVRGHTDAVTSVSFSPDGQRILTGSRDRTAKVWQASTGKELLTLNGHGSWPVSATFSSDGRRIVTCGFRDGRIRVWEADSGTELPALQRRFNDSYLSCCPEGYISTYGGSLTTLFDPSTGKTLIAFTSGGLTANRTVVNPITGKTLMAFGAAAGDIALSPDGKLIAAAAPDYTTLKVLDTGTGRERLSFSGHSDCILKIAFSPDGRQIASGSQDRTAKVWDVATGKELLTLLGYVASVDSVVFSPDGRRVITGSSDGAIKVWDVTSGKELLTLKGSFSSLESHGAFRVWDVTVGREEQNLRGFSCSIFSLAISRDGRRIATPGGGSNLEVWDAATPEQVASWQREEGSEEVLLARSREHRRLELATTGSQASATRLKGWFVLGPIPFSATNGEVALDEEQIPQEALLRIPEDVLRPGANAKGIDVGDKRLHWVRPGSLSGIELVHDLEGSFLIDFSRKLPGNPILGDKVYEWSVGYAVCYLHSEKDQAGLVLKVGSDDQAKLYLNGKQIYRNGKHRFYTPDQDVVNGVELKAGLNVLVFKVVNEVLEWQGSVSLSDAAGQPIQGISWTNWPSTAGPGNGAGRAEER
jgi:eukaryotic-like serine/threonine-protein kinase